MTLAQINQKARIVLREALDPAEFALYVQQFERRSQTPAAQSTITFAEIRSRLATLRSEGRLPGSVACPV
jgi:hypothetical protein